MEKKNNAMGVIKYISGLLGFISILFTILLLTGAVEWFIIAADIKGSGAIVQNKLTYALVSSILGVLLLFIAFSKQIDSFFNFLETKEVKTDKKAKGISVESIFFLVIGIILIVLVNLLAIGTLQLKQNIPILGNATKTVLIIALIILSISAIVTAFHGTIIKSIKEMKKVQWPNKKEMVEYSKQVFTFIIFFSIFFFALDLFLTYVPGKIESLLGL